MIIVRWTDYANFFETTPTWPSGKSNELNAVIYFATLLQFRWMIEQVIPDSYVHEQSLPIQHEINYLYAFGVPSFLLFRIKSEKNIMLPLPTMEKWMCADYAHNTNRWRASFFAGARWLNHVAECTDAWKAVLRHCKTKLQECLRPGRASSKESKCPWHSAFNSPRRPKSNDILL